MNLIQLQNGMKAYGKKVLFDGASFAINVGEHVGVIGPNGAGKTTLFKILVDQQQLDFGTIIKSQQLRIGYLEQEAEWSLEQVAEDYLKENCQKPIWDLKKIGKDLGLTEEHFRSQLKNLSGGYRMRMKLLFLIGMEPNLMLLDEPTNFLDLESVLALESFLQNYDGAFLLISHDREFLKRTTEATLEVEAGDITKYPGHIDDYFEQKAMLRGILEAQAANQDAKRKQVQSFIDRFGAKATKARQAQSRMKLLEKMEVIEIKDLAVKAKINIPDPIHTGKETLALQKADIGYDHKIILQQVTMRLERGTHLGVVGYNGVGKSTLLKSLAGQLPLIGGNRVLGYQVSLSHFSQHSAEQLDLEDRVIDALEKSAHPDIKRQQILNIAGSLLFSGDDIYKKIKILSGGEKSRVALGQILLRKSPLLLLDEPTNHLDFETVEALTEALRAYEGSLVVVSHDRSFVRRVASKILEINNGKAQIYPGNYDDYVWSIQNGALKEIRQSTELSPRQEKSSSNKNLQIDVKPKANFRDESKRLNSKIRETQNLIAKFEAKLQTLAKEQVNLTESLMAAQGQLAGEISKQLAEVAEEISVSENSLIQAMEDLEKFNEEQKRLKE